MCRLCGDEEETLRHIFEKCKWTRCGKEEKGVIRQDEPGVKKKRKAKELGRCEFK